MNKTLAPCPDSPNCVSSQSSDEQHAIDPLLYKSTCENAYHILMSVIASQKRSKIIIDSPSYIRAEYRSPIFGFVDDVEFVFDDKEKIIHCRSASRSGYFDFGVNRRRIERIRQLSNSRLL